MSFLERRTTAKGILWRRWRRHRCLCQNKYFHSKHLLSSCRTSTIFRFSPSRTILMLLYKMCAGWGQEKMSLSDFSANIHNLFSKSKYNKLRRGLSATERIIKIQAEFYQNFGISFTDGRFRIWIERSAESFTIFSLFFQLFSDDIAWSHQSSLLFGLSVELAGSLCSSLRVTSSRAGEKFKNSLFCCYRIQALTTVKGLFKATVKKKKRWKEKYIRFLRARKLGAY